MIRDIVQALDYSDLAEVSLILFAGAFAMVAYALVRLSRTAAEGFASVPLNDEPNPLKASGSSAADSASASG